MSAAELIDEIKKLPPEERKVVLDFLRREVEAAQAPQDVSAAFKAAAEDVFSKNAELFRKLAQ